MFRGGRSNCCISILQFANDNNNSAAWHNNITPLIIRIVVAISKAVKQRSGREFIAVW